MKLKYIFSLWGVDEFSSSDPVKWTECLKKIRQQGYSGIEIAIDFLPPGFYSHVKSTLKDLNLCVVVQIHTCGYPIVNDSVEAHLESLRENISRSLVYDPVLINCHSGKDSWNLEKSVEFFKQCLVIEKEYGVSLCHETHRSRCFYSPWNTREITSRVPSLKFTADLSHWVLTAERLFSDRYDPDWPTLLDLIAKNSLLIHARVGTSQTPQICDFSPDSLCVEEIETFETWWRTILSVQHRMGKKEIYVQFEYGPFPYMPHPPQIRENHVVDLLTLRENAKSRFLKLAQEFS